MKTLPALIVATAAFIAVSGSANPEPLWCSAPAPATVRVDLASTSIQVSTDVGLNELRQASGHQPGPIVGAYRVTIGYAADVDGRVQEVGQGRYCATPQYVILRVQLEKMIYVPQEFVGDECLSALAHEHEGRHAEAQSVALEKVRPRLLSAVNKVIGRSSRDAAASGAEALAVFTKEIQSAVEEELDQIDAERAQLNAAVDTPDELDRLSHACQGRALRE
jgi:hypothetical protein